jgi:hypothetical protein
MPQAEHAPQKKARWLWLDRWLEPPWRALLTWLALAALSGYTLDAGGWNAINRVTNFFLSTLKQIQPIPIPAWLSYAARLSNWFLFVVWFEPLILRLNLLRGLAWLGLRILPFAVVAMFHSRINDWEMALGWLVSSSVVVPVLWRQRSPSWVSAIAGVIVAGVQYGLESYYLQRKIGYPTWILLTATTLPYAAIMLYCTRLISSEERMGNQA